MGDGRYVITGLLGTGAQAHTFEALDKRDGQLVALKRFSVAGAQSWKDVELAEREARVLSGLNLPGLPRYVAHFEEDGSLYLAMEKIGGQTFAQLSERQALSQGDVIALLNDTAQTLELLHGRSPPVIHRDIKPHNLIQCPNGRAVLVDFGSVRDQLKPSGGSTVVGTFGYMAPEQFQGRALPATDTYALAATALSLLTRKHPSALPHQGLAIDVERSLDASVDARLKAVLRAALDPDPDRRGQRSMAQLLSQHGLRGRDTASRATGSGGRESSVPPSSASAAGPSSARSVGPSSVSQAINWSALPLLASLLVLSLWVARVLISAALLLLIPIVLLLLSLVFGPQMKRAARQVQRLGRKAQRALYRGARRLRVSTVREERVPRDTVHGATARPAAEVPPQDFADDEASVVEPFARRRRNVDP